MRPAVRHLLYHDPTQIAHDRLIEPFGARRISSTIPARAWSDRFFAADALVVPAGASFPTSYSRCQRRPRDGFLPFCGGLRFLSNEAQPVVDRFPQVLTRSQIPFGRLDRSMAQQKLDLLQFSSG